ncbi:nucleoid-associated protein NdpA [Actinobacillus equuli]|nr:nucleoid-associated protein NdpA [Actinobacillus equuli]
MLVDDQLDIKRTEYLDITQYDIACRINLTELKSMHNQTAISPLLKDESDEKLQTSLWIPECGRRFNPQLQNQTLLQAVSDYCDQGELSARKLEKLKSKYLNTVKGKLIAGKKLH